MNPDVIVAALLLMLVAVCKATTVNLPYYWDEMLAYVSPAHWLNQGGLLRALPGFHPPHTFFGHPFAIYITLAGIYRIFGESILVSHVFVLFISYLGLYYTYLLGTHIAGRPSGIIASLLLFFSPLFFAQSGMVTGDIVITSLGVITIYYVLKRNYVPFLISGILLVLSKESAIAIIVALLIYLYWEERKSANRTVLIMKYSIPLLVIIVFFALQKATTGMFLPNEYFESHSFFELNIDIVFKKLKLVLTWIFTAQYRVAVLAMIVLNIAIHRKRAWQKEYLLFGIIHIFFIGAFTGIYFIPRYILPVLPYFFIMGAISITTLFSYKKLYTVAVVLLLAGFASILHGRGEAYGSHEMDLQYVDVITTHQEACRYIENNHAGLKVLTSFPLLQDLSSPFLGYVKTPIQATKEPDEEYDLIMYSRQGGRKGTAALANIINRDRMVLLKRFERNGKAVDIYVRAESSTGRTGRK